MKKSSYAAEATSSFSYHGGAASALESASDEIRQMAGNAFTSEKRERAELYLEVANLLKAKAVSARKEQKKYDTLGVIS